MLSCSGGTAEKQRYEGTAGDSLASPDACSGGTAGHEVTGQKAPVKVKVSHSLLAVGQWVLESHCILDTADERRSPSLSFRCLILP